jgi:dolichyl-phosphate beta-glucosyltransferase
MSHIAIVVPCYNEAARLDVLGFQEFATSVPDVRFLFVNDGSTDDTAGVLDTLRLVNPRSFGVLHLPANAGKAEAVRRGMLAALEQDPDHVGYWDADLATPLRVIPAFRTVLEERPDVEVVIGSRVRLLGRRIERRAGRHYLGRIFATAASAVLGVGVYDTQCGAKLFRASATLRQVFERPFRSRWIFDVEIFARLIALGRRKAFPELSSAVYELPLTEWQDVGGSKVKPRDFLRAALQLGVIYWTELRPAAAAIATAQPHASPCRDGMEVCHHGTDSTAAEAATPQKQGLGVS